MSRIFWDTNLFIYLIENRGEQATQTARVAEKMRQRGDTLFTSTFTLGELLVRPTTLGNRGLCDSYESILSNHATLISFDAGAARSYALIRGDKTIKAPDAIQLACASHAAVDMFITNDARLAGKLVPGIQFIVPLANAYL
ncbi:MAG: PIN domain-containing protein [Candidatus Acidiferrales bacterium]